MLGYDLKAKLFSLALIVLTAFAAADAYSQVSLQNQVSSAENPPAPGSPIEFSVVSIKPNRTGDGRWKMNFTQDGYIAYGVPFQRLIQDAYGMYGSEAIEGYPGWALSLHYDLNAKVDDADQSVYAGLTEAQGREMLQRLLGKYFGLKAHMEKRQRRGFALVVVKSGSRLPAFDSSAEPDVSPGRATLFRSRPGQLTAHGASMDFLAKFLTEQVHNPVVDETGLAGRYNVTLDWTPDNMTAPPPGGSDAPSLFTALKEQLGLSLKSQMTSTDVLVIDHVDQPETN